MKYRIYIRNHWKVKLPENFIIVADSYKHGTYSVTYRIGLFNISLCLTLYK
jgi:endo-alpha-1,4-polygalactosaminidase (GH114 family)